MSERIPVIKTPKVYVGGAFIRSESGRTLPVYDSSGQFVANVPQCTRKDLRNAVEAAAAAGPGWSGRTPYNRGQIIYRLAEMLEARADEMTSVLRQFAPAWTSAAEQVVAETVESIAREAYRLHVQLAASQGVKLSLDVVGGEDRVRCDRDRVLRWFARVLPREFRERVFEPALADLQLGEAAGTRRPWARTMLALECLRIGLPQYLWRRSRPTRTAVALGVAAIVVTLVAVQRRYVAQWKAESPQARRP